jgi:hypothetical protein
MPTTWPRTDDRGAKDDGDTFVGATVTHPISYNLTAAIVADLGNKLDAYGNALATSLNPATRTRGTIAAKNALKKTFLAALRAGGNLVKAGLTVSDPQKADAGLPLRDPTPTPIGPPSTYPLATLSPQGGARHELRLSDSATPTRRRRPRYAVAAEVRFAVAAAGQPIPGPGDAWSRTAFVTRSVSEIESDPADAGKTLVAQPRWLGTKGQVGPWGPIETGTIAA